MSDEQSESPQPAPGPARRPSRLAAWLQLLRVPNLLTVPGDPLAGFLLAGSAGLSASRPVLRMSLAAAISLLLYSAGLLWNDCFDLAEDLRDRPHRPLPSGLVRPFTAATVANALILVAIGLAAVAGTATLYVAAILGVAVIAYDARLKHIPLVGPLTMGLCRGLSLLVGAAAFATAGLRQPAVIVAAVGLTLYIAAVTHLAAGETRQVPVRLKSALVAATAGLWLGGLVVASRPPWGPWRWAMVAFVVACTVWLGLSLARLRRMPRGEVVQQTVGRLIRGLVLVQATIAITAECRGPYIAAGLVAAFLLNGLLARRFHGS